MKQEKFNKLICFILAGVFTLFASACTNKKNGEDEIVSGDRKDIHESEVEVSSTETFFKDGKSDYIVVIPDKSNANITKAVEELNTFFSMSTGYRFDFVTESEYLTGKFISIGQTKQLTKSGIVVDYNKLGESGYRIISKDNNIYITSNKNSFGCICAVYDFLENVVGYEFYSNKEFKVKTLKEVPFYNFNVLDVPTVQKRNIDYYSTSNDTEYATRLMLNGMGNSAYVGVHTELQIMPYSTYGAKHPDWYSNAGKHLCYSNEDVKKQYIKNIEEKLASNEQYNLVNCGLSDNNSFCSCDKCTEKLHKYGTESAVMLLFINDVVKQVNQWLKEYFPDREVQFLMLAYQKTVDAPVSKNADGKFIANDDKLICEDNLGIYIADAGIDYGKRLDSERNKSRFEIIQKWATLSKKIYIYTYSVNFSYYFCNFPNYLAMQDNYELWTQNNVESIDETGVHDCPIPTLEELRFYLMSKLMRNSSLNFIDLVKKFMKNYYQECCDSMYEYFTKLSVWQKHLYDDQNSDYGYLYYTYTAEHWPKFILDGFNDSIQQAYKDIEQFKTTDIEKYNKLFNRIKKEELSIEYMYLSWYKNSFERNKRVEMLKDLEKYCSLFGITDDCESSSSTIFDTFNGWRID